MKLIRLLFILLMATPLNTLAQKGNNRVAHTLELTVKDKDNKEPIIMATIQLQPTGMLDVKSSDGKLYDLQGREVTEPAKGLYIKNGKKYIAK